MERSGSDLCRVSNMPDFFLGLNSILQEYKMYLTGNRRFSEQNGLRCLGDIDDISF